MALAEPIENIILPEFRDDWYQQLHHQWFVTDVKDINQVRLPGKFIHKLNIDYNSKIL